ncbi:MAG TPA: cation:proton antiporter [Balneolaceae bacterium]|nr:cation:proton antiporter [Balneolaceae bacterium]
MNFLTLATKITFVILSVTLILAFFRIMKGPSLPDRVIAIDILAYVVIGFIATFCVAVDQSIYFDIALVLALIAFLSTIAFARYISNRHQESE